jgi:hypothetical protein
MAAQFPTSPTDGQVVVVGGVTFVYNSTNSVWQQSNTSLSSPTFTSAVFNTSVSGTAILDEDDMSSNSATKLATQQSIKAYIDNQNEPDVIDEDDFASDSATRPPTQQSTKAYVKSLASHLPHGTTITFTVTSATKTSAHRYNGSGSSLGYFIDGIESPFLILTPGRTYRFDQSHASMATHGIRFYQTANKTNVYTTNVTENGTAGTAGAYIEITITDSTPGILHYQCNNHEYMGNAMQNNTASGDFNTLLNKPTTIAGYGITDSPSVLTDLSITDGSADQVLKTDGAGNFTFTSVSALSGSGIQNIVEDTSPQLGGRLDANGNVIRFANLSSNPSSPQEGDVYYNTDDNALKIYADGEWGSLSGTQPSFLTRQVITHGFVMGGYKDASPWRNVNTMVHATDVMTNNGDVMPYSGAYTSGACSLTRGYLWSTDNTWPGSSAQTSAFNMTTYASYTGNNMRNGRNDCATVFKEHEMAWICGGGNGNVDVFNLSNDTMYGSDQGINTISGDGMQSGNGAHSGETKGYIWQDTNDCRRLTFASGTAVTIATPGNAPGINSQQKGFADKLGYGYAGNEGSYNGGNNLRVWNYTTESYSTVAKPIQNSGEENLDMGQAHQYMMGMYDGAQNNRGWKFTYATNSGSELGSGSVRTGPPGGSSGHCVWRG